MPNRSVVNALGLGSVLILVVLGLLQIRYTHVHAQGVAVAGTLADITGTSAAKQLTATSTSARWVMVVALRANGATVRIGDSLVSASRGAEVAPGGGYFMPPMPVDPRGSANESAYDLSRVYFYGASPDKVSVTYGR
jgi:hypothetical protein